MESKKIRLNLKSIYTLLIIVFPILLRYISPIPKVMLSEFLIIIFCIVAFLKVIKCNVSFKLSIFAAPMVLYLPFQCILLLTINKYSGALLADMVGTTARLLLYYIILFVFNQKYFEIERGAIYLCNTAVVMSLYAILQIVAAFFGVILTTYIPFLPVANRDIDLAVQQYVAYGFQFRCRSFFTEPASLCTYLLVALCVVVFFTNESSRLKHRWMYAGLFTVVIVISRSSTGIICAVALWCMYGYRQFISGNKERIVKLIVALCTIVPAGLFTFLKLGALQYFLERTFRELSGGMFKTNDRLYAIGDLLSTKRSAFSTFFGEGLADTFGKYLPGYAATYYFLGILGIALTVLMLWILYKKANSEQRCLWVLFIILNIGTEIILGNYILLYFAFISYQKTDIKSIHYQKNTT